MTITRLATAVAAAALLSLLTPAALAKNQNEQRLDVTLTPSLFAPTQAVADASHTVRRYRTDFVVQAEDLDPAFYDLYVADQFVGQISVRQVPGGTEGSLRFSSRPTGSQLPLNFDPRGKLIEIRTGMTTFFSGTLSTIQNPEAPDGDPTFNQFRARIHDAAPGFGPRPRGTLFIQSSRRHAFMLFNLQRLDDTVHTITANGIEIATFSPLARGIARVRFSTNPGRNDRLLDFDPANTTFQVRRGSNLILEFVTPDRSIGGGTSPIGQIEASFNATGAALGAFGSATLRDRGSRFDLTIEVGNLEPGPYALRVAGSTQGEIHVSLSSDLTRGILQFSTLRDSRHLPLTFDPRGQTIQIVRDNTVFLSMTFPE